MRGKDSYNTCKCCGKADETIRHMAYGCKWAKDVRNIVFTEWWGRIGDSSPVTIPSFRRSVLCTVTKRESSMDTMRRTLNHITLYFIWREFFFPARVQHTSRLRKQSAPCPTRQLQDLAHSPLESWTS